MATHADFTLTGDLAAAQATTVDTLKSAGFTYTATDTYEGIAERGNRTLTAFVGAFAGKSQHFKIGVSVFTGPSGDPVIRVMKSTTGAMGGYLGVRRMDGVFAQVLADLKTRFTDAGVLLGYREA
jgi:hypothetical protein